MASKAYVLSGDLKVTVYKRKSNRSLKLSLTPNGQVRVSIPAWAPYSAGLTFAQSRLGWIQQHLADNVVLQQGQAIGKAHHLQYIRSKNTNKITGRVKDNEIRISIPDNANTADSEVQNTAHKAAIRALRAEAEHLLPLRLATLAKIHGFDYRSVTVRQLKGRWGSCDQDKNITLNLFLMQLDWPDIDYVLMHELAHTRVLKHGPEFWREMEKVRPGARQQSKAIKKHQPVLNSPS